MSRNRNVNLPVYRVIGYLTDMACYCLECAEDVNVNAGTEDAEEIRVSNYDNEPCSLCREDLIDVYEQTHNW